MEYVQEASVTEKVGLLQGAETGTYDDKTIPGWGDLQSLYEQRWNKEKQKFQYIKSKFFCSCGEICIG